MDLLLSIILPTLICAIPFMALFRLANSNAVKHSAVKTTLTVISLTLLNIVSSLLAMSLCIYGLTRNLPEKEQGCVTGAATFIMLGFVFAMLTFGFGAFYIYRN